MFGIPFSYKIPVEQITQRLSQNLVLRHSYSNKIPVEKESSAYLICKYITLDYSPIIKQVSSGGCQCCLLQCRDEFPRGQRELLLLRVPNFLVRSVLSCLVRMMSPH